MLQRRHQLFIVATWLGNLLWLSAAHSSEPRLPERGVCAHRGASATHPENTLAALREAVRLGAHMIEFDVALSRDGHLVLLHDATVDRTTNGSGNVADLTLSEIERLDAGKWKGPEFAGERVPTLAAALEIMPVNIWLNVHLKGDVALASQVARQIVASRRQSQAFLACGSESARAAKEVDPKIKICNMDRRPDPVDYVHDTVAARADFIQLKSRVSLLPTLIDQLDQHRVRINYCCTDDADQLVRLWASGVRFVLVDRVAEAIEVARQQGMAPLVPVFREEGTPFREQQP